LIHAIPSLRCDRPKEPQCFRIAPDIDANTRGPRHPAGDHPRRFEIETMVSDFVQGHAAQAHPRSSDALRAAFFGGDEWGRRFETVAQKNKSVR
jgi:hypothetical protein